MPQAYGGNLIQKGFGDDFTIWTLELHLEVHEYKAKGFMTNIN